MGSWQDEQPTPWIATSDLPTAPGHPFYARMNAGPDAAGFAAFVEAKCRRFHAVVMGGRGWPPAAHSVVARRLPQRGSSPNGASRGGRPTRSRSVASCTWDSRGHDAGNSTTAVRFCVASCAGICKARQTLALMLK
jgi:hypothetical protein